MNTKIFNGINNKFKIVIFLFVLLIMFSPVLVLAQDWPGLVPCDQNCNCDQLMHLVNRVVNFIFVYLAIPILAIMFAYAGILLITAGGESASAKTKAKGIFTNAVSGFLIMAVSWIVIHSILEILGFDGSWIGF